MAEASSQEEEQYAGQLRGLQELEAAGQISNIRPVFIEGEMAGYDYDPLGDTAPKEVPIPRVPVQVDPADRYRHDQE